MGTMIDKICFCSLPSNKKKKKKSIFLIMIEINGAIDPQCPLSGCTYSTPSTCSYVNMTLLTNLRLFSVDDGVI